jgi:ribokinase
MGAGHVDRAEEAIAKSHIVLTQFEVPLDAVSRAMELGRKHGAMTLWNPAPAQKVPAELLANVDIITPNETEARILAGLKPDDPISMDLLADRLAGLDAGTVIVTLGKKGAFIIQGKERELIPAPVVEALDPTGAGDTFNAALAVGLGEGLSLKDAVRQANFAAAYCVRHLGVIGGLPKKAELEEFIEEIQ